MSVPSTLVKCLYLFFDLPHMAEAPVGPTSQPPQPLPPPPPPSQEKTPGQGHTQPELPLADRRALLQKVFVQVKRQQCQLLHSRLRAFISLCSYQLALCLKPSQRITETFKDRQKMFVFELWSERSLRGESVAYQRIITWLLAYFDILNLFVHW